MWKPASVVSLGDHHVGFRGQGGGHHVGCFRLWRGAGTRQCSASSQGCDCSHLLLRCVDLVSAYHGNFSSMTCHALVLHNCLTQLHPLHRWRGQAAGLEGKAEASEDEGRVKGTGPQHSMDGLAVGCNLYCLPSADR